MVRHTGSTRPFGNNQPQHGLEQIEHWDPTNTQTTYECALGAHRESPTIERSFSRSSVVSTLQSGTESATAGTTTSP